MGKVHVATEHTCGPLLIVSPALKGNGTQQGVEVMSPSSPLVGDF